MLFEISKPEYENLPFLLTTIGMQEKQQKIERPNGSLFHHFLFVTNGTGHFKVGERDFTLAKNQGLFTRQSTPLFYAEEEGSFSTAWLTFRGSGANQLLDYYNIGDDMIFDFSDQLIVSLNNLEYSLRAKSISARSVEGYAFVINLLESLTMPHSLWEQRALQIRQYLESHFDQPITLDELAQLIGTDRYTLCRRYKQFYGVTIVNALREIRIAQAKEMLINSQLSVQEICTLCGFESPSYFGKLFKQQTSMSPVEYRHFAFSGTAIAAK